MRLVRRLLAACIATAGLASGAALAQDATVLTAARMLDVRSGKLVENPQLLIRDGRIAAVGRAGDAVPAGARRIDLPGMTLLPGLIDMHTHLDSDPTYGGYTYLEFNDRFWSMLAVKHAEATLQAGFTTVRNVGADA
jgi:imidazolonepropionase-like amidohydrolase